MNTMDRPSRFAILGSGPSTGLPWLQCVISKNNCCAVCKEATSNPTSLNRRNNPSALYSFSHPDGQDRHVLIDVGKTFRDTVMRTFPSLGVDRVHAVLLTHPHADAVMGLDDLRDVSPRAVLPVYVTAECFRHVAAAFPYLVNPATAVSTFVARLEWRLMTPWEPFSIPEAGGVVVTPIPVEHGAGASGVCMAFEFGRADPERDASKCPVPTDTIKLLSRAGSAGVPAEATPRAKANPDLPTGHGAGLVGTLKLSIPGSDSGYRTQLTDEQKGEEEVASAPPPSPLPTPSPPLHLPPSFEPTLPPLHEQASRVLYVSDVVALDAAARAFFRARRTHVLILDALNYNRYSTHYSMCQSVNCAADIAPRVCRMVGMNHRLDHALECAKLEEWGRSGDPRLASSGVGSIDLGLAHDGWCTPVGVEVSPGGLGRAKAEVVAVRQAVAEALALHTASGAVGQVGGEAALPHPPLSSAGNSTGINSLLYGPSARYDYSTPDWPVWKDEASPTVTQLLKGWTFV